MYSIRKLNIEGGLLIMSGLILLFLIAKEAFVIPLTHDELSTIDYSQKSLFDIITYADPVPNNHILNTLLLKLNIAIFGELLFTDRIHNVLSFILFYFFSVKSAFLLFKDNWLRFCFVALLSLQPYLLDFFSVTRGYGLSVAFQMVSIFYFYRRLREGNEKDLWYSVIFGAIGVYANFTLLNYYMPLVFLLGIHTVVINYKSDKKKTIRPFMILGGVSIILGLLCYLPFSKMLETKQFVYWGTSGFFSDTVKPLIISLRAGTEYFGWTNDTIYGLVLGFIIVICGAGILLIKRIGNKTFLTYSFLLLISTILYNHVQFWLAGVPFLNARTALFLIPLVSIVVCYGLEVITCTNRMVGLLLTVFVISLSCQHFVRGFNGLATYEWYNDADTYVVLKDIEKDIENQNLHTPVKVDCHWVFHPSMTYHIKHLYSDKIELMPYHKTVKPDTDAMFYYTGSEDIDSLSPRFGILQEYSWRTKFLMKTK